ncbi:MAG: hypothetical protein GKS02_03970 [Alphaproteobacteria bacterium]|nr:hypothetical protein [Alphaproteobacteria bacterium]
MFAVVPKLGVSGGVGLLLGLVAVWWVEPTTNAGIALLIGIFIVASMVVSGIATLIIGKKRSGN